MWSQKYTKNIVSEFLEVLWSFSFHFSIQLTRALQTINLIYCYTIQNSKYVHNVYIVNNESSHNYEC